jgi:hypothetical protein
MLTGTGHASAEGAQRVAYEQQADRLGLTTAEKHSMQSRVDAYMKEHGGTQVALNKISLDDQGSYALLTLPGEKRAREVSDPITTSGSTCDYYYFCIYESVSYDGNMEEWKHCNNREIDYVGYGSWVNNQTPGTRAQFKSNDGVTRWTDAGAFDTDDSADWNWVHWVKAC